MTNYARLLILSFLCLLNACGNSSQETDYKPKPIGYNRIDLPPQTYQLLTENHPYSFEYSSQAVIKPDTFRGAEPHWLYVHYPAYKADVQLTYKSLKGNKKMLMELIADAHKLAAKHNIKAYSIEEVTMKTPSGKTAAIMELEGEVPSQFQFYTTDSTQHYLRGALYFNTAIANDSLAPIIEYIKKDVIHLLNTLKWKKNE